jgi:hypothetical protein
MILTCHLSCRRYASISIVLKMADDRREMYDGFSDKGAHSVEWFEIAKNFLKLVFAGDRHEAKCPCNRCQNRKILSEYEMSGHIAMAS